MCRQDATILLKVKRKLHREIDKAKRHGGRRVAALVRKLGRVDSALTR